MDSVKGAAARRGLAIPTFEYPDAPPAFGYWIETDRYWRVDYRVGASAPGVAAVMQDLRTIDGVPTTYATVLFSEPVRLQTDDISTTVELLGAGTLLHPRGWKQFLHN